MKTEIYQILISVLAFSILLFIDERFHVVKKAKNQMKSSLLFNVLMVFIVLSLDVIFSLYFYKTYNIHPTVSGIHAFSTGLLLYLLLSQLKH